MQASAGLIRSKLRTASKKVWSKKHEAPKQFSVSKQPSTEAGCFGGPKQLVLPKIFDHFVSSASECFHWKLRRNIPMEEKYPKPKKIIVIIGPTGWCLYKLWYFMWKLTLLIEWATSGYLNGIKKHCWTRILCDHQFLIDRSYKYWQIKY